MALTVLIDYTQLRDAELNEFTDHVIAEMTGNANFPSPPWAMGHVQNAKINFLTAVEKAQEGKDQDTTDKNNKQKTLTDMLRDDATYVNIAAKGDELKLRTSGFKMVDPSSPVGVLPAPETVTIKTHDIPGRIEVNQDRQKKAKIYVVLYTDQEPVPEKDEDWKKVTDTASRITIKGLQGGQEYSVKAGAKATEDEILFSPVRKVRVL